MARLQLADTFKNYLRLKVVLKQENEGL